MKWIFASGIVIYLLLTVMYIHDRDWGGLIGMQVGCVFAFGIGLIGARR